MSVLDGISIPDALARSATHWGEPGRLWLESLPARVDDLVGLWKLSVELPLYLEGQCSIVLPVRPPDGTPCVLKVGWPHPEAEHEADALRVYDGRGAVLLIDEDTEHNAFLLERCEPGTPAWEAGSRDEVLAVNARAMRRLWRPLDDTHPFDELGPQAIDRAEKVRRRYVEYGRQFDEDLAEAGAAAFEEMAGSTVDRVLLHGDYHPENVLAAQREPWLVVDPNPLAGDPAFDTAQLMLNFYWRKWPMISIADELAELLELDANRILRWTFARAVEEITWSLEDGKPIEDRLRCARVIATL